MKKSNSIFLTVAAIITVQFYAGAAFGKVEPVVLRDGIDVYRLDRHLEILEDEKGEWTIDDVTSTSFADRFKLGKFNLGLSGSVFWFRFRVKNETRLFHKWKLIDNFGVHYLDLYYRGADGDFNIKHAGLLCSENTISVLQLTGGSTHSSMPGPANPGWSTNPYGNRN